jgi:hypothetical protein
MTPPLRFALGLSLAASVGSCAIASAPAGEPIGQLPSKDSFIQSGVSEFMEKRCGSLDCHGQVGRPLRLYSQWGLRKEPGDKGARNSAPTTALERDENYYSVAGLEPENLATCFATKGADFKQFQLLKKPLDIAGLGVRHKGGPVLRANQQDAGWLCLYGWASGDLDAKQCQDASKL